MAKKKFNTDLKPEVPDETPTSGHPKNPKIFY